MQGARYKDIQDWILRNEGYTVKSCWVAHVKEIPTVPPYKVLAIKRALRHVGII